MEIRTILEALQRGELSLQQAQEQLQGYANLGHSRVDLARQHRSGSAEVIFGEGKSASQILAIINSLRQHGQGVLATRVEAPIASQICAELPNAEYHHLARLLQLGSGNGARARTPLAVVCAGTSDLPIAEEAALTAEFYGNPVERVYDVGVAGLHRLLDKLDTIRACRVVIAVAGMEGALPSVIGGLVKAPVIAVPTSVGYGTSYQGISALLGMLNSCASGISVVNIDNGFGAGFLANRINRL